MTPRRKTHSSIVTRHRYCKSPKLVSWRHEQERNKKAISQSRAGSSQRTNGVLWRFHTEQAMSGCRRSRSGTERWLVRTLMHSLSISEDYVLSRRDPFKKRGRGRNWCLSRRVPSSMWSEILRKFHITLFAHRHGAFIGHYSVI